MAIQLILTLSLVSLFSKLCSGTSQNHFCYVCEPKEIADVVITPSVRTQFTATDIDTIADCKDFTMNESFVKKCPEPYTNACVKAEIDNAVWRMCGSAPSGYDQGKCHKIRDTVLCICDFDKCNSAYSLLPWQSFLFSVSILTLLLTTFRCSA